MNYTSVPKTISFDGKALLDIRNNIDKYPEQKKIIIERADKLLATEPFSVTYKKLVPPSKDPHDYMTMGTYWWPDPNKPDGLPYIRKDGIHNPDATDRNKYQSMAEGAYYLAHAAYVFDNEDYANKALEFIKVWHVDEKTRMNPHAEYSQAIPGICEGRGIGLIDFRQSYEVFDACEMLLSLGVMSDEVYSKVKAWYVDFINWMITSEKGIFEDNYFNNHGVWYDVQILAGAIFTDRPELAKRVAMNAYRRRHKTQIKPDGTQPHELARTNAMGYSSMNLLGLVILAKLAKKVGFEDYVNIDEDAGVLLIGKAAEFLLPYATDQKDFPYQQIKPGDHGASICTSLLTIASITGEGKYREMAEGIAKQKYLLDVMPV